MLQVFCTRPSLQGWRWCDPPPCWSKHWHLSLLRPLHYHIALSSPKCTGLNSDILSLVFYASQVIANTYSKVRSWTTSLLWREGCDGGWKTERCNDFFQPPLRKADILITTEQRHCIYHPSQDRKKTCGRARSGYYQISCITRISPHFPPLPGPDGLYVPSQGDVACWWAAKLSMEGIQVLSRSGQPSQQIAKESSISCLHSVHTHEDTLKSFCTYSVATNVDLVSGILGGLVLSPFLRYFSRHFHDLSFMAIVITNKIRQNKPYWGMNGSVFV